VHRLTQKIDVIVYKITIKDTVEERILDGKGGLGKLGMKEILQLFRRDAENAPRMGGDTKSYDLGNKPRILKEREESGLSYTESQKSAPRRATPPVRTDSRVEDKVYGRRW